MAKTIFITLQVLVLASCGFQRVSKSNLESAGNQFSVADEPQLPVNFDEPHPGKQFLIDNCLSCHAPGAAQGGYTLTIESNPIDMFSENTENAGFYLIAGDSVNSTLLDSLDTMPLGNPASLAEIEQVAEWIDSLEVAAAAPATGETEGAGEQDAEEADNGGMDGAAVLTFEADIAPIFQARCINCHDGPGGNAPDLSSYAGLMNSPLVNGPGVAVIPGAPFSSTNQGSLVNRISREQGSPGFMPQGSSALTPVQVQTIKMWISQGAVQAQAERRQ